MNNKLLAGVGIAYLVGSVALTANLGGRSLFSPNDLVTPSARQNILVRFLANANAVVHAPIRNVLPGQAAASGTEPSNVAPQLAAALEDSFQPSSAKLNSLLTYFDGAQGDANAIQRRVGALADLIGQDTRAADAGNLAAASQRIRHAVRAAIGSTYVVPVVVDNQFALGAGRKGWDFGGAGTEAAASGFTRVGTDAPTIVRGAHRISINHGKVASVFGTSLSGVSGFTLPLADGDYKLLVLSRAYNGKALEAKPFGGSVTVNGVERRVVSTLAARPVPYLNLKNTSIIKDFGNQAIGDENSAGLQSTTYKQALVTGVSGLALVVPVHIHAGKIDVNFADLSGHDTLISGVVPVNTNYANVMRALDTTLAMIAAPAISPAAGGKNSVLAAQGEQTAEEAGDSGLAARFAGNAPVDGPAGWQSKPGNVWVLLNSVTKERAVDGLLTNTPQGSANVQAYLDGAGGDTQRLQARALGLVDAVFANTANADFVRTAELTNHISAATDKAAKASYITSYHFRGGFRVPRGTIGYDFGPAKKATYTGFQRIAPGSSGVLGRNLKVVNTRNDRHNVIHDGISGITGTRTKLPNGVYRVYAIAPETFRNPFGRALRLNGAASRRIDLRAPISPVVWTHFVPSGIQMRGGLEAINAGLDTASQRDHAKNGEHVRVRLAQSEYYGIGKISCVVLTGRAFVENGVMTLDFDPGNAPVTLAGLMTVPDDYDGLKKALADKIGNQLAQLSPAAGLPTTIGGGQATNFSGPLSSVPSFAQGSPFNGIAPLSSPIGGGGGGGGVQNPTGVAVAACPAGTTRDAAGVCQPTVAACPAGTTRDAAGVCQPTVAVCPAGTTADANGVCQPTVAPCPTGTTRDANGVCQPTAAVCPPPNTVVNGVCTAPAVCSPPNTVVNGVCTAPATCPTGQHFDANGICVPDTITCPAGQHVGPNGTCVPDVVTCPAGQHADANGNCVPDVVCPTGQHLDPNGVCVPDGTTCPVGQHIDPATGLCVVDGGPVPEPGTLSIVGLSMAAIVYSRRRKQGPGKQTATTPHQMHDGC